MSSSPEKLMFTATGGIDGWVSVNDVTGVVRNSAAFVYDHDSGPQSVTIYDIDVPGNRLLLWANGAAINASGYTVGNGASLSFPGGSYSNPSAPVNTSGMLAPYVLNGVGDTVPFTISSIISQTAKLQSWQVAGRETSFIDRDGVLVGPVLWQTYPKDPMAAVSPVDLTRETYWDTDQYMVFMRRGVEESLSFAWSMPHGWNGGVVIPHIHVIPCANPTEIQYVYLKAAYCWTTEAGGVPVYSSWTHIAPFQFAIHPGDIHKQFKIAFPNITPPTQPPELRALLWHFERVGDEAGDTYTSSKLDPANPDANLAILGVDLHYQSYARGSISIDGGPYNPPPVNLGQPAPQIMEAPVLVQGLASTGIPMTVEGVLGQTAKLQSWGVNNIEKAYVASDGSLGIGSALNFTGGTANPLTAPTVAIGIAGTQKYASPTFPMRYAVAFVNADGDTALGPYSTGITQDNIQVTVTNIPIGPAEITKRLLYRYAFGEARLVATLNDNTTTSITDDMSATVWQNQPSAAVENGTSGLFERNGTPAFRISPTGNVAFGTALLGGTGRYPANITAAFTNIASNPSENYLSPSMIKIDQVVSPMTLADKVNVLGVSFSQTIPASCSQHIGGVQSCNFAVTHQGTGIVDSADGGSFGVLVRGPLTNAKALLGYVDNNSTVSGFLYGIQSFVHNWAQDYSSYGLTDPPTHGVVTTMTGCRIRVQNHNVYNTVNKAEVSNVYLINANFANGNEVAGGIGASCTNFTGLYLALNLDAVSTITNSKLIHVDSPGTDVGVLTNHYGIYVADQTVAGATTNYSVYVAGGKSHLGGMLDISPGTDVVPLTINAISGQTAKLMSLKNNNTEKAYVDKDGGANFSGPLTANVSTSSVLATGSPTSRSMADWMASLCTPGTGTVIYVGPSGNDANTGSSWADAKRTFLAAYDAMGGVGTMYVMDQTQIGGEVTGQGLRLMGPSGDANYGTNGYPGGTNPKLNGWRPGKVLRVVGVGGNVAAFGGGPVARLIPNSGTDFVGSGLWVVGNVGPLIMENIQIGADGAKSSGAAGADLNAMGSDGSTVTGVSAFMRFTNCVFQPATNGPSVMTGWTFWTWFDQCVMYGNPAKPLNSHAQAAFVAYTGTSSSRATYLTYIYDCRFSAGGVILSKGSALDIRRTYLENDCNADAMIYVEHNAAQVSNPAAYLYLEDLGFGDGALPRRLIAKAPTTFYEGVVVRCQRNSGGMDGASEDTSPLYHTSSSTLQMLGDLGTAYGAPTAQGFIGVNRGKLWGSHDGGRRIFALAAAQHTNLLPELGPGWGALCKGPDGRMSARDGSTGMYGTLYGDAVTPVVGDWLFAGMWIYHAGTFSSTTGFGLQWTNFKTSSEIQVTFGGNVYSVGIGPNRGAKIPGNAGWVYYSFRARVTELLGGAMDLAFSISGGGTVLRIAQPSLFWIPASDNISDSEAAEIETHMAFTPKGCAVGELAVKPGQKIGFYDATLAVWKYLDIDNGAIRIT